MDSPLIEHAKLLGGIRKRELALNISDYTQELITNGAVRDKEKLTKEQYTWRLTVILDILQKAKDEEEYIRLMKAKFPQMLN